MKSLIEIYQKMDAKGRIKAGIVITVILLFIIGTVSLIISDQRKAQKRQFAQYQQQIMQRLLDQQEMQQKEQEYTEADFNEAKNNLPPVEEMDFDSK